MIRELLIVLLSTAMGYAAVNDKLAISSFNCNQMLHDKYMDICFDYGYKSAIAVGYNISKDNLYKSKFNIDGVKFHSDKRLPKKYRVSPYSSKNSKFYNGHLAPKEAFNYDIKAKLATFSMANITPKYSKLNKFAWNKVEEYSRDISSILGEINVLDIVYFSKNPKRLKSGQAIPVGYAKIITNKEINFQKCFYYVNNKDPNQELGNHIIDCTDINLLPLNGE